jgi:hypothetical protein
MELIEIYIIDNIKIDKYKTNEFIIGQLNIPIITL